MGTLLAQFNRLRHISQLNRNSLLNKMMLRHPVSEFCRESETLFRLKENVAYLQNVGLQVSESTQRSARDLLLKLQLTWLPEA